MAQPEPIPSTCEARHAELEERLRFALARVETTAGERFEQLTGFVSALGAELRKVAAGVERVEARLAELAERTRARLDSVSEQVVEGAQVDAQQGLELAEQARAIAEAKELATAKRTGAVTGGVLVTVIVGVVLALLKAFGINVPGGVP